MAPSDSPDRLFLEFQAAVAGRYSLERELGRGGMGIVYLAREVRLDRPVAIKLLPQELAVHPQLRDRFLLEARTAARLSHPNIVPIHVVDEVGPFVFYAMAFIDGETLAERVERRGPLPPGSAARVLREVAWALAYAHDKGIIHRDVKPENILLERGTERALVTDFGIARIVESQGTTGPGGVLGTPAFMSPEQASGDSVDGRSDLYSLGIVGYYLLSGKLPFSATSSAALMAMQVTAPAPAVATAAPDAPSALCQAIDRCLAKPPDHRFATGEELAEAVQSALDARPDTPAPVRAFLHSVGRHFAVIAPLSIVLIPGLLGFSRGFVEGFLEYYRVPSGTGGLIAVIMTGILGLLGLLGIVRSLLTPARRLLRAGYGWADVRDGARLELARRQEELSFEREGGSGSSGWWVIPLAWVGAILGAAAMVFEVVHPAKNVLIETLYGAVLFLASASTLLRDRRSGLAGLPATLWSGRLGRAYFRLAARGDATRMGESARHATEIAVGLAVDDLFADLPAAQRRALGDLPETVGRLLMRAQDARVRIASLDRDIAQQGSAEHAGLVAAREAAERDLGSVAAALENIRLSLLRVRAGAVSTEGITKELDAARRIAERVEALLQDRA